MEEFQSRNINFDTDKFMGHLLASPLLANATFDTCKIKHRIENIDHPGNIFNSYLRLHLNQYENNAMFGSQKDEEFLLDSFLPLKTEEQQQNAPEISSHNTKLSTSLDPYYDNQLQLNMNLSDRNV